MATETAALVPALIAGGRERQIHMPVWVMTHARDEHRLALERARQLTFNFTPPTEACAIWRALHAAQK